MADYNAELCELYRERVDKIDDTQRQIVTCVESLTCMQKEQIKQTSKLDERLTLLERHPRAIWDKIITGLVCAIISAVVTVIIGGIL